MERSRRQLYWNKRKRRAVAIAADESPNASTDVDVSKIVEFLRLRRGADGISVSEIFGPPEQKPDGWFRLSWLGLNEANLPTQTEGPFGNGCAEWVKAWHACKFEALHPAVVISLVRFCVGSL